MRLQSAISLNQFQEDAVSGFGSAERRQLRRDKRRQRKGRRAQRKADRRLTRIQKKRQRLQHRLGPARSPAQAEPALQPAPTALPARRRAGALLERAADWVEDFVDDPEALDEEPSDEDEGFEEDEDATEGIGAWMPLLRSAVEAWGPSVQMGRRLRIQAAVGHRAAVIELKPGLFLVAEMPEALMRTEFGLAPLLAPMMMTAARRSMDEPRPRRGPFARLFRRRQPEEPVRYVTVVRPAAPGPAPRALTGPVEDGTQVVAAPNVGWADDATVAAAYGCEACDRGCGR